ncbi:MAG: DUF952 domain-containing protein [Kordiimonas sp.]
MVDHIYKALRPNEWKQANSVDSFSGSPDDIRDGFIHFSTRSQLETTVAKYFSSEPSIHITRYRCDEFSSEQLKWEKSRNGVLFPHLYGSLPRNTHIDHWIIQQNENGVFDFTALPKD